MNSQEVLRGICVALALAVNGIGRAATVYVNGACGDDAWTGASPVCAAPDGPKASIKTALNVMAPGDEELVAAPRAPHAREAFTRIAAGEELLDRGCDDGTPEAVTLPVPLVVDALELVEVSIEQLPER